MSLGCLDPELNPPISRTGGLRSTNSATAPGVYSNEINVYRYSISASDVVADSTARVEKGWELGVM